MKQRPPQYWTKRHPRASDGFTLLEILVAMAILAFALSVIAASASSSAIYSRRVYSSTAAALLLRSVILDIEEKYRKDGFPTNDIMDHECKLPKVYSKEFRCSYDLVGLQLDDAAISDMTQQAQELLAETQEQLQQSGALDKLEAGRQAARGKKADAVLDELGDAAKSANQTGLDLSSLTKGGDMMQLIGTILMSGEAGVNLLNLCDINISVLQMSMGLMIAELLPRILKRASDRTRKVVIRLSWRDAEGDDRTMRIETFTTAVSEKEAQAIQQFKDQQEIEQALQGDQEARTPPTKGGR